MAKWKTVQLADLVNETITGEWGTECKDETMGTKVLRTTNFTNLGIINYDNVVLRDIPIHKVYKKKLIPNDIILEKSGGSDKQPVGRVVYYNSITNDVYLCNNFTQILRIKHDVAYSRYVFLFLFHLHQTGTTELLQNKTTGIRNLQIKSYMALAIPLPPLSVQQQIADVLDRASALIEKRKAQMAKLDLLVKSQFIEMFGDPVTNPMGWEQTTIGDSCHYVKDGPHVSPSYVEDGTGIPFISTRNLVGSTGIDWSTAKYISEADYETYAKKCKPENGDILYTKGGTTGVARFVDTDIRFANWVHVAVLKFGENLNGLFFENMLNSNYCYHQSQLLTKGIANKDLVLGSMKQIQFYIPPLDLQTRFAEFVRQADKSKFEQSLAKLELNYKSLMQKCFRGEIF